ncbi:MAG: response regulator [Treponema sp.]|nr:response regulator [Treponema sp.]
MTVDTTRYKIVLVDDNIATLSQGKSLLKAFFMVFTIKSAAALFKHLEHDIPDLILLDVEMPGMDGFEAIAILKADIRYRDIPVIFLTSRSDEASERKGFSLGAADYITKPFSGPLLQKRISNQLLYKRVEAAVRDSSGSLEVMAGEITKANERIRMLLDKTPLCARLWDSDGKMIDCNEAAVEFFGFMDKEECMRRYSELYPEYQPDGQLSVEKVKKCLDKAFKEGKYAFEWTYKMLDGTLIPAEVVLVKVEYRDGYIVAGYTRDLREQITLIKEMRRAELAEESSKAKSRFLANMSHEMRTPLNVVLGITGLMLEEDTPAPDYKENLMKIGAAGNTLLRLINDVLDISKIEAGKLELTPVTYEVPSLLNEIITFSMLRIEDRPITFVLNINENLPYNLYGDDLRVKQIINNLLSNAFKYTKKGTVSLGITAEPDRSMSGQVWMNITVSDTGIGIHEEDIKKLFTDYYQVESETNRKTEGTGLGLSITKRLVEMMNGEISVESEFEKGSVYRVRIRQKCYSTTTIGPAVMENIKNFRYTEDKKIARNKLVRTDLSFAKVLVVDDMQPNLDVAAGLLGKYKMQVDCVLNGQGAVDLIKNKKPVYNAIFMDHMMPGGMDGIETAIAIRNLGTEYAQQIPIIALTANAIAGTEDMFYSNGFQDFISKPINIMHLDSILRTWINPDFSFAKNGKM